MKGFKREKHLVRKAMRNFLMATMLTMAVQQVNVTVDGIIVSRLVCTDALSAINLYMPLQMVFVTIFTLLGAGATVVASRLIGEQRHEEVNRSLSTALMAVVVAGVVLGVLSYLFVDVIADIICHDDALRPLFRSYAVIQAPMCILLLVGSLANQIATIYGRPKLVSKMVCISAATNVVLDLLLVGSLGFGISGSAIASVIANLLLVVMLGSYILSDRCTIRLNPVSHFSMASLGENLKQGMPIMISNSVMTALFLVVNNIIQDNLGTLGLFTMSIGVNILMIGTMLSTALSATMMSIGGLLIGQGDNKGLLILVTSCVRFILHTLIPFAIIVSLFPGIISGLFGADAHEASYADEALRVFVWMMPTAILVHFLAPLYQRLGYLTLTPLVALMFPVSIVSAMYLFVSFIDHRWFWHCFPVAGIAILLLTFLLSETVRCRGDGASILLLLPKGDMPNQLNITVRMDTDDIADVIRHIEENITVLPERCRQTVITAVNQHLHDILPTAHYADIIINRSDNDTATLVIKDDGKTNRSGKEKDRDRNSKYMYGQNMLTLVV